MAQLLPFFSSEPQKIGHGKTPAKPASDHDRVPDQVLERDSRKLSAEFRQWESLCLNKLSKVSALYGLLYRQYREQCLCNDLTEPCDRQRALYLAMYLAMGILCAQGLAQAGQAAWAVLEERREGKDMAGAEDPPEVPAGLPIKLDGRLCFALGELRAVLQMVSAPLEFEPVCEAMSTMHLCAQLPGFWKLACHNGTPSLAPDPRGNLQVDWQAEPAGTSFWYWEQEAHVYFSLSRLGRLQLRLGQALRARIDRTKRGELGGLEVEKPPQMAQPPQLHQSTGLLEHPELLYQSMEALLAECSSDDGLHLRQNREILRNCLAKLCHRRLLLLCGGPGSGKTSLLASLLQILRRAEQQVRQKSRRQAQQQITVGEDSGPTLVRPLQLALCAPTARAAQRMLQGLRRAVAAATNSAASSESLGFAACTLHKLLGMGWSSAHLYRRAASSGQNYRSGRNLELLQLDLLVVDEASMLDSEMAWQLLSRLHPETRLLLIGDLNQLPPVGPGAFWKEVLAAVAAPAAGDSRECLVELQGSHRSVREIRELGQLVLQGETARFHSCLLEAKLAADSNRSAGDSGVVLSWYPVEDQEGAAASGRDKLLDYLWQRWRPRFFSMGFAPLAQQRGENLAQTYSELERGFKHLQDFSVLSPLQNAAAGARSINNALLKIGLQQFDRGCGQRFYHGCPVQVTRNNYDQVLFNGDRGFCCRFGSHYYAVFPLEDNAAEGSDVALSPGETLAPVLAHGMMHLGAMHLGAYRLLPMAQVEDCEASFVQSIHKSQGSEYRQVCVLLPQPQPGRGSSLYQDSPWSKALLYTAITRAKQQLCFLGSTESLHALVATLEHESPVRQNASFAASLLTRLLTNAG